MKKYSLLARLMVLVLCFALVFSGCGGAPETSDEGDTDETTTAPTEAPTTPADVLGDAIDKTFGDDDETEPSNSKEDATTPPPSDPFDPTVPEEPLSPGKFTFEMMNMLTNVIYFDPENSVCVNEFDLDLFIEQFNFVIYSEDNKIAVSSPDLFGVDVYGVDFSTLLEDLPDSAIWDLAGTSYDSFLGDLGLEEKDLGELLEIGGSSLELALTLEDAVNEAMSHIDATSKEETVLIHGKDVPATVLTFTLTSDDAHEIAKIMLDWYEEALALSNEELAAVLEGTELEYLLESDIPFDDIRQEMEEIFGQLDLTMVLHANVHTESGYLMSIGLDVGGTVADGPEVTIYGDLVLGEDPTTSELYTLELGAFNSEGMQGAIRAELECVRGNVVDNYGLTLVTIYNEEENVLATAALAYNSETYAYELAVTAAGYAFTATGTFRVEEELFDLTVDTIESGSDFVALDLHIRYETVEADEIPEMPAYTNVLKLAQDELTDLIHELAEKFGDF